MSLRASREDRPAVSSSGRRPAKRSRRSRRPSRGGWGRWLIVLFKLGLLGAFLAAGLVVWYAQDLPDIESLNAATRRPAITLVSMDGETIAAVGDVYGETLDLGDMPNSLPDAVLATEDRRFYSHFGLDPIGLARAVVRNLTSGSVQQGGSTITQQLAKVLFLTPERTLKRKVQEAILAFKLENRFTKREILTIYLNRVYLGSGTYGADAAARRYFGKSARKLSLYESALLAGLLKAPSRYSPANDPEKARARTAQVLENMVNAGVITADEAAKAKREEIAATSKARPSFGRYFTDWVLAQVLAMPDTEGKDLTVVTTLDRVLQIKAEAKLKATLEAQGEKLNVGQGALVVLAADGAVKAYVGGRDYDDSQFDRAHQARRQPGSSFKSFVYLAALEAGMTPEDTVDDAPIQMGDWSPDNYTGKYLGPVSLKTALAQSLNAATVRLAEEIGLKSVIATARRLGILSELRPDATLALGSSETSPLELAGAYASFSNGGLLTQPFGIIEVSQTNGPVLWHFEPMEPRRVISPRALAGMHEMLGDVIANGTGKAAALSNGRAAAGKTGTSQNYRDAWFAGFTADRTCVVWMGNDDGKPMKKVVGGGLPARLWRDVMDAAHAGLPPRPLAEPWSEPAPFFEIPNEIPRAVEDAGNVLKRLLKGIGIGD
ncbi:MAG: PBP1A family penicillin-binding protein [Rhodospirillales bacterium]|nr:MAG: PBP1A family penicillin-binding protein [Rhodospirillales bacterium]